MARGPKGEKRPGDVVGAAVKVAKIATGEAEEELPDQDKRKAGHIGGKNRASALTPERRTEIARRAGNSHSAL